ncbi:hypothetical protein K439DRAFT_1646619 [Ramaria rubella]|nr:hypothetical protein K439DRAFT_1646619 [Ramaria rubella]
MYPPTHVFLQRACENFHPTNNTLTLRQPSHYEAMLFTKGDGALPVYSHSLYCAKCFTRYHPIFCVNKQASMHTYYDGLPDVIQVSQRYFFETALLELQANAMCFACTPLHYHRESGANCMQIYNQAFHAEHTEVLILPHDTASQRLHLELELAAQNRAMEGFGQESYTHACHLCCLFYKDEEGQLVKLQAVVSDGITIGHPCCGIHDCKVPLANVSQDIYCPTHLGYESKCVVTTCGSALEACFLTCEVTSHRALERAYQEKGSAFVQMHEKIQTQGGGGQGSQGAAGGTGKGPNDAIMLEGDATGASDVSVTASDEKAPQGNRCMQVQFCQRHTHNEQLIIRPCGVIVSRAILFSLEAVSAVRDFVLPTFPTPESMPECFFYDTNCRLLKHCQNIGCARFNETVVVVDVFHFERKHKQSDGFCQENCNPALFPELYANGKCGFLAMVREMPMVHFNFFLDEMIKKRNCWTIKELERKGHEPWNIPMAALLLKGVPCQGGESKAVGKGV